jgi:hypothetical protein
VGVRRLIIAIDCDDVLVPCAQPLLDDYNKRFGTSLNLSHFYQPVSLESWGTDEDEVAQERVNKYFHSEAFAAIRPVPGVVDAVKLLAHTHELHVVTGRPSFLEEVTRTMLDTYFKDCFQSVEHTNYIVTRANGLITRSKGEVCAQLHADVLIDDHIVHGRSVLDAGVKEVIVFGDYPWNSHQELLNGMKRCRDWEETAREIDRIAG